MFILTKDNVITRILSGDPSGFPGSIQVPSDFAGRVGQNVGEFRDDWSLKPISERVADGYVQVPRGYKLEGESFVALNQAERYEQGIDPIPEGYELVNGELSLIMTPEIIKAQEIGTLETYLSGTDWYVTRFAETGKAIPEDILAQRSAARERISELRVKE